MILIGMLSVGLAAVALMGMHQFRQVASWPSLDEEPPLAVPQAASPTDSWLALEAVMSAVPMEHRDRIRDALEEEGMPAERGIWVLAADQVEALSNVMESSSIVSPTRSLASEEPQPSLIPLLPLAQAQILRGWDSYDGGEPIEAAEDMLLADRLGQQLVNGSQSLLMSVIGHSIQTEALAELQELLSLVHEPSVHALAAERLPLQAPQEGSLRAALLRECANIEALLLAPDQSALAVLSGGPSERLVGMLYDVDATVAQHRRVCRAADAWAALLPVERGQPPTSIPEGLSEVVTYNITGVKLLQMLSMDGSLNMVDGEREGQLRREVLRLLTAARLHGFAHSGQLPAGADALVPEYLPTVPLDPFTGAALEIASGQIETSQGEAVWVTLPSAPGDL